MLEQHESELLSAYVDGELNEEELKRVNSLLAASPEWRDELEQMRTIKLITSKAPRMKMPLDLVEQLEREANGVAPRPKEPLWKNTRPVPRTWLWAGSAATAAVMLTVWVGVRHAQADALPLAPLLAAHVRQDIGSGLGHGLLAASDYSQQLKDAVHAEN